MLLLSGKTRQSLDMPNNFRICQGVISGTLQFLGCAKVVCKTRRSLRGKGTQLRNGRVRNAGLFCGRMRRLP